MKALSTLAMLAGLFMFTVGCSETATTDAPAPADSAAPAEGDHEHADGVEVEEEVIEETRAEQ